MFVVTFMYVNKIRSFPYIWVARWLDWILGYKFKGFNFDLSHISIILMETLSWPWALNAYYKTINHWHATDHRQPTTDPSTGPKPPTDLRPLTHRPYENKPTDRQPTNHIRTNPHSIDPPAPNPPTGPQLT